MTAWTLLILLTAHFVADFLCQTDEMATRKSSSWMVLTWHVAIYTLVMSAVAGLVMYQRGQTDAWANFYWLTFVTHFVTDAITSRWTSKLWFFRQHKGHYERWDPEAKLWTGDIADDPWTYEGGNRHWFFCVIGFDQLIHAWTLALTWMWVTR